MKTVLIAALSLSTIALVAQAQTAPTVTRTLLQKHDVQAPGLEQVMALTNIPPGAREGRHTHPAEAMVYVLEGVITLEVEGKPQAAYKAGESFFIERGKVHEGMNLGTVPAKAVAVFVADKGKPLTAPAK